MTNGEMRVLSLIMVVAVFVIVAVCTPVQFAHAKSTALNATLARSIAVQRYLGRHNHLPLVSSIGTLRSFDSHDDTGSGFQKHPTQVLFRRAIPCRV